MSTVFADNFDCKSVNKHGKFFDRVSRIEAHSENYEMDLLLDINSEIYSIKQEEKFELALATSIQKDGTPDPSGFDQRGGATMLDDWEYVMHGKVFKIESDKSANLKVAVYVSFGGLLMQLKGDHRNLPTFKTDTRLYLLIRKAR